MRFWDSSAIVPLLVDEASSPDVARAYEADPDLIVWWATGVECVSALARLEREGSLSGAGMADAIGRLDALAAAWQEVQPVGHIRRTAIRLLRVHALRSADAMQLAAARAAAEDQPETLPVVTLDSRLAEAAQREGFGIVSPAATG
jgi:uncharacterized protein